MENDLSKKIESILFWKAEPMKLSDLVKILDVKEKEIKEAVEKLKTDLSERGVVLVDNGQNIEMTTSPESSEIIELLQKEELTKDLSKAALETLSIILYRGPLKRSEVDYIRGVNSQFSIRSLLIRGLIEKKTDPKDERAFIYRITLEAMEYLGIKDISDLPDYNEVNQNIDNFLNSENEDDLNESKENA